MSESKGRSKNSKETTPYKYTPKRMPNFEFMYPEVSNSTGPFVQPIYDDEPLCPVPLDLGKKYSGFISENVAFSTTSGSNTFVLAIPSDPLVSRRSMQTVLESLVNGRIMIAMDKRLGVWRAARLLKIAVVEKALQEHLVKGCRMRPALLLQCLEAVFDLPEDDVFRQERFQHARQNFLEFPQLAEWTKVNVDVIRELISDDAKLKVQERDLYRAVLKWLVANPLQIAAHCDRLLGLIRFGSMSTLEKLRSLEEAQEFGLDDFIKPYVIEADWYRTCHELNHAEFTDLIEFDRVSNFIGENRRVRAIDAHPPPGPRWQKRQPGIAVTIDTKPSALERAQQGTIVGGTYMARPRPSPDGPDSLCDDPKSSAQSMMARMSTVGLTPIRDTNAVWSQRSIGKQLVTNES